jgi:hypothetical protein
MLQYAFTQATKRINATGVQAALDGKTARNAVAALVVATSAVVCAGVIALASMSQASDMRSMPQTASYEEEVSSSTGTGYAGPVVLAVFGIALAGVGVSRKLRKRRKA